MDYQHTLTENVTMSSASPEFTTFIGTEALNISSNRNDSEGLSFVASVIVAVVSSVVSFITVAGNVCVFYIIYTDKRLLTYTNYYILALSASDIVAGAFTMPLYSVYWILGRWPFSDMLCDVYLFLNQAFIHISIIMIVTIAYDRWDALEHPLEHLKRRTLHHALKLISLSYAIPLLLWLFGSFLWPYLKGSRDILPKRCYPQYVTDNFTFLLTVPFIIFWGPFFIICVLYARIYQIIRRTGTSRKQYQTSDNENVSTTGVSTSMTELSSTKTHGHDDPQYLAKHLGQDNPDYLKDEQHAVTDASIGDKPGPSSFHNKFGKEHKRANRTLTLILIAMIVSALPWSALVPIYSNCRTCIPLALYQVRLMILFYNKANNLGVTSSLF